MTIFYGRMQRLEAMEATLLFERAMLLIDAAKMLLRFLRRTRRAFQILSVSVQRHHPAIWPVRVILGKCECVRSAAREEEADFSSANSHLIGLREDQQLTGPVKVLCSPHQRGGRRAEPAARNVHKRNNTRHFRFDERPL